MNDDEIRPLTLDDIPEIIARVTDAANESGWINQLTYDAQHIAEKLVAIIQNENYLSIGSHDVGAIMIASISDTWYSPSKQANEMVFYVHPEVRCGGRAKAMVKHYIQWAKDRGAERINIGVNLGIIPEKACYLCESLGFKHTGFTFTQSVEK